MNIPWDRQLFETIKKNEPISRNDLSLGFGYHLDFSIPQIAMAIHAGHHVREDLLPCMILAPAERMFEEDIGTDVMIQGHPNAVWGLESRAVYDLNRDEEMALPLVPEKFWGTRVYGEQPTPEMKDKSLGQHRSFYLFMGTVIRHMLDTFGYCIVYDIHSYNITRQQAKGIKSPPVFNLGTTALDRSKWKGPIDSWLENLRKISLPGITTTVAENDVFSGQGELCKRLSQWDPRILVLPTEVSKVYMDEKKGALYPPMIKAIQNGLIQAMASHAAPNPHPS